MTDNVTSGLMAALDIAAFREIRDGTFESLDVVPGWYLDFSPRVPEGGVHRLGEVFPFVENFLSDARKFWAKGLPGHLKSGNWSQNNDRGEEQHFEAIAVCHHDRNVLLVERLGEEFDASRRMLQRVREQTLQMNQLARIEGAFRSGHRPGDHPGALPSTTFRLTRDGIFVDSGGSRSQPQPDISELVPNDVAQRFRLSIQLALDSGGTRSFDYADDGPDGISEFQVHLARSGSEEVFVQVRDISSLRRAEREIEATLDRVRLHRDEILLVLNELHVGALRMGGDGEIVFLNVAAGRMLCTPQAELEGKRLQQVSLLRPEHVAQLEATMAVPRPERTRVSLDWSDQAGNRFWVDVDVHDEPGDPKQRILLFHDVSEVHELRRQLDDADRFEEIIGRSPAMHDVFHLIEDLASVDATVLVEGETGTGKELVARALHSRSLRSKAPFVAVNCGGLTESLVASQLFGHRRGSFTGAVQDQLGVFEAAEGGAVFLDEIGDIPPAVQTSLLRVLQEKEITRLGENHPRKVDVRVIAATHRNLDDAVATGRFRADLLYRIRVARIRVPPLRERLQDLQPLAVRFLGDFRARTGKPVRGLSAPSMRCLTDHPWPGNVREMQGAIEFAAIRTRTDLIEVEDLPPELRTNEILPRPGDDPARFLDALRQARGNRTEAARLLGISRATFYRRVAEMDLDISGR